MPKPAEIEAAIMIEQAAPKTARLASIATRFDQPVPIPQKTPDPETETGTLTPLYIEHPPIVSELIKLAYEDNWVRHDLDWPKWMLTAEAQNLAHDSKAMEQATTEQLAHLLTAIIRQDRFVDGATMDAFKSGLLQRVLTRICTLDQKT